MGAIAQQPRCCPLCGGEDARLLFERDGWPVVRCSCAMVYLAKEISYREQSAQHEFSESYAQETERRRRASPLLHAISRFARKLKPPMPQRLLGKTLERRTSGRLLDVGCGDGSFLQAAARHFEVTGVEISAAMAERARQRVRGAAIHTGPLTEIALPDASFDVVTLFSVLEHEWRPLPALAVVARVLRRGGVAILKAPNFATWNRMIRGAEWCGIRLPDHCNYFTPATLSRALVMARLTPRPRFRDMLPTSDSLWMAAEKI
ncbi:MAG: class I SAM-dependent methyltransferase [Candidatus Acidiferrales bacterium]